jgi:hypothetical protein
MFLQRSRTDAWVRFHFLLSVDPWCSENWTKRFIHSATVARVHWNGYGSGLREATQWPEAGHGLGLIIERFDSFQQAQDTQYLQHPLAWAQ